MNASLPTRPVFVVDGARTPFLKAAGRANPFAAADLAVAAARPLLLRQPFEPHALDEVILGNVMPAPEEMNIARVVSLRLGCGHRVPAWSVHRNCASGMQALDAAVRNIQGGHAQLVLAGGVEAMSRAPLQLRLEFNDWLADWQKARGTLARLRHLATLRPRLLTPVITLLKGLTDPVVGLSMGQTAEKIAHRFNISREEMDHYAVASHQRLAAAWDTGFMKGETVPLNAPDGSPVDVDNGLRRDSSPEQLAKLRPVFDRPVGTVTAGNSAQVSDGACLLLLASEAAVKRFDLKVMGMLHPAHWVGVDPAQMGLGPVHAIHALLQRHDLKLEEIDGWEINEAFAAQVLACRKALADPDYCRDELGADAPRGEIPMERLNMNGGGISMGHPVGASGARIVLHLLRTLNLTRNRRGVASLCIGGGQGGAMLVETV